MNEKSGVLIAVLSSALGGGAAVATRYLIGSFDPIVLATVRFGGGALCLLPIVLLLRPKWPPRQDWPADTALGFIFFAVFLVFYNAALSYTTVGRGALALSTLPLMTMVVGAVRGLEALTVRKTTGVLLAMCGVALALTTSLKAAPDGAWRSGLIAAPTPSARARSARPSSVQRIRRATSPTRLIIRPGLLAVSRGVSCSCSVPLCETPSPAQPSALPQRTKQYARHRQPLDAESSGGVVESILFPARANRRAI